ncbi:MAG: hypothetical protein EBS71_09965 [Actinobacteria bacterium]|nr:hypothetical protein [Actinomycetota bacterium]
MLRIPHRVRHVTWRKRHRPRNDRKWCHRWTPSRGTARLCQEAHVDAECDLGIRQAGRNANDAIGFVQVMEGAMDEMGNMVTRMREFAIAAASDTYSAHEREMMDLELTHSLNEIRRISSSTELFGSDLLNGDNKTLEFQVDVKNQALKITDSRPVFLRHKTSGRKP